MNVRPALLFAALLSIGACSGPDAAEAVESAQAALDEGETTRALELTAAALPAVREVQDGLMIWRLETIAMQALAEEGRAEEAIATLGRLAEPFPNRVTAPFYARLANRAAKGGELIAAIEIADAGLKRFPDRKTDFEGVIADIKRRAVGDNPAMERLYAMGYMSKPAEADSPDSAQVPLTNESR